MAPYDVIIHTLCVSAEAIWKWTGDPFPIPRGCVIGGLCAVVIWKLVQNKKSSPCSSSKESDNVDLEDKKLKLTDKLENVAHRITTLRNQKMILENQRQQFKLQLEDLERDREDNKEKLQSVERLITESERERATDRTEEHLRRRQMLLNAQWKLESRKEKLEQLQLNTEKQLQSEEKEGILTIMIEKKKNLENMMKELQERESQRNLLHDKSE